MTMITIRNVFVVLETADLLSLVWVLQFTLVIYFIFYMSDSTVSLWHLEYLFDDVF
jgi:hypothetical protein